MTRMFVKTKIRLAKALEGRQEAGQGTLEYVGIVIVAAILILAVIAAVTAFDLESKLATEFSKITGAGGE